MCSRCQLRLVFASSPEGPNGVRVGWAVRTGKNILKSRAVVSGGLVRFFASPAEGSCRDPASRQGQDVVLASVLHRRADSLRATVNAPGLTTCVLPHDAPVAGAVAWSREFGAKSRRADVRRRAGETCFSTFSAPEANTLGVVPGDAKVPRIEARRLYRPRHDWSRRCGLRQSLLSTSRSHWLESPEPKPHSTAQANDIPPTPLTNISETSRVDQVLVQWRSPDVRPPEAIHSSFPLRATEDGWTSSRHESVRFARTGNRSHTTFQRLRVSAQQVAADLEGSSRDAGRNTGNQKKA